MALLKVVNLENLTDRNFNYDLNASQIDTSRVLRVGLGASLLFGVGALQWLFYYFVYSRFIEDKIGKFIDFCSISNISIFILTHTQYGYYIHGRSPHGFSDSSMYQMIQALSKEEYDLMAKRGLEPSSNHQTFSIFITFKLSRFISKITASLTNVKCFEN